MPIESGTYVPKTEKSVTYWEPGTEVPEGFTNVPSKDNNGVIIADNYIAVDKRNRVLRSPQGEPYSIVEGCALVVDAQGEPTLLTEDDITAFLATHERSNLADNLESAVNGAKN